MRFVNVGGWVVPDSVVTFVGPFDLMLTLFKTQRGYLHFLNACLIWFISPLSTWY